MSDLCFLRGRCLSDRLDLGHGARGGRAGGRAGGRHEADVLHALARHVDLMYLARGDALRRGDTYHLVHAASHQRAPFHLTSLTDDHPLRGLRHLNLLALDRGGQDLRGGLHLRNDFDRLALYGLVDDCRFRGRLRHDLLHFARRDESHLLGLCERYRFRSARQCVCC